MNGRGRRCSTTSWPPGRRTSAGSRPTTTCATSTASRGTTACGRSSRSRGIDAARRHHRRPARSRHRLRPRQPQERGVPPRSCARDGVAPYPGSALLLDALDRRGTAVAVVSSSRNAPAVLAAAGLADRFGVVVDGSVLAAERHCPASRHPTRSCTRPSALGVDRRDAVVVEDAVVRRRRRRAPATSALVVGVDRGAGARGAARRDGADARRRRPRRARRRAGRDALTAHRVGPRPARPRHRFPIDPWRARRARARPRRRPRPHRDAVRRRQRLPRHARQPRGGPRRARPRHLRQRLPRDVARSSTPRRPSASPRIGQTIVNVPDAKVIKLYVDDEPLAASASPTSSTTSAASTSATACCAATWSGARRPASGCGSTRRGWSSMTQPAPGGA